MYFTVDATKVIKHFGYRADEQIITGSSAYRYSKEGLVKKQKKEPKKCKRRFEDLPDSIRSSEEQVKERKQELYRLNKSKVRRRITTFFETKEATGFCAFYTVTFPFNTADEEAYTMFHTWLVRCRKEYNLSNYIWVAERQKNKTVHFHMLTSTRMPIREVNRMMGKCIQNRGKKGAIDCNSDIYEKYNGVDVDNIYYSKRRKYKYKKASKEQAKRRLSYYLTKYITKNDTTMTRLPWHCSRTISKLFTSIIIQEDEYDDLCEETQTNPENFKVIENEYFTIYFPKKGMQRKCIELMIKVNDMIMDMLNSEKERIE